MSKPTTILTKLANANRRQILLVLGSSYIVIAVTSFILSILIFSTNLQSLTKSQSYSISIQEWRGVLNGILSGWSLPNHLDSLCIIRDQSVIAEFNSCQLNSKSVFNLLGGKTISIAYGGYEIFAKLKFSLWFFAIFLPIFICSPVLIVFLALKKPLTDKIYFELIEEVNSLSKDAGGNGYRSVIAKQMQEIIDLRKQNAIAILARQVAHDIRSPLFALNAVAATATSLPEEQKNLLLQASQRINNIAANLLESSKNRENTSAGILTSSDLINAIDQIVAEVKTTMSSNNKIIFKVSSRLKEDTQAVGNKIDLERILSNLLTNSIESIEHSGEIHISSVDYRTTIGITISDTGVGIKEDILPKLVQKGATFSKTNGNGLGLYSANETLKTWNATLTITSKEHVGTSVQILLNKVSALSTLV